VAQATVQSALCGELLEPQCWGADASGSGCALGGGVASTDRLVAGGGHRARSPRRVHASRFMALLRRTSVAPEVPAVAVSVPNTDGFS
jgi:hypothetical protein